MKVSVDDIGSQGLELKQRVDREPWLLATLLEVGEMRAPKGVALDLRLTRLADRVDVRGQVALDLLGPCARCVDEVGIFVSIPIDVALVPLDQQPQAAANGELMRQDIELGAYVDREIDLGTLLHDEILLEMPAQVLCTEECLGLCGHCGVNRNLEPCTCAEQGPPLSPFAALAERKSSLPNE